MTHRNADPYAAFRLDLEQQHKRAKDLLKRAKAGEPDALRRLHAAGFAAADAPKLAQAQHCISRELRFANWAAPKRHIGEMQRWRRAPAEALDADCRTMHIRCGHDFVRELREAGLHGAFNAHINPYLQGPVAGPAGSSGARDLSPTRSPLIKGSTTPPCSKARATRSGAWSRRAATTRASSCGSSTIATISSCCFAESSRTVPIAR